ncbi:hypothetical protein H5410_013728 [Solanum commersonii]|uniref:Leucine-rich repeat-containing N-terminal plant-type domain-containing protein n=1 Tax=Solanum commersonii TaxID=4109 RepID=A0A9J5ZP11_SOLCO|nr:hypothetical protein H5410_013728 [Solanum commersonii]
MGILFFFYSLVCFWLIVSESFSSSSVMMHHVCSSTEAFALLHFKQSFQISDQPSCWDETHLQYDIPKTKSWNESRDCCSWDGVTCDMLTGHVIGLDLSCSLLLGTIHPNSSLFQLHHLRTLNLAHNAFFSSIPHNIGRLTNLRHLNLSGSFFEGEMLSFTTMKNLLLTDMQEQSSSTCIEERNSNFSLYGVNISSSIPVNISSSSLRLKLGGNDLLKGVLPKIHPNNTLLELEISSTGISDELPDSIGTFSSLNILVMYGCQLSGRIPDSVGNLTQIRYLDFGNSYFTGHIPSTISKLKQLTFLGLSSNSFSGEIPDIFSNLQELRYLYLQNNKFHRFVSFYNCKLDTTSTLILVDGLNDEFKTNPTFKHLDLSHNQLSGSLLQSLSNLTNLSTLVLSSNNITVDAGIQITFPSLEDLLLSSCELKDFPHFLRNVKTLWVLDISNNKIRGQIPNWFSGMRWDNLWYLNLSHNSLTGHLQQFHFHNLSSLSHVPQPLESEDESYFFRGFTWESVVIGYSCGLVVGTVVWSLMFKYRKLEWFVEFFEAIYPKKMRRSMKRAQRRWT